MVRGRILELPQLFGYPQLYQERVKLRTSHFMAYSWHRKKSPLKIAGKVAVGNGHSQVLRKMFRALI